MNYFVSFLICVAATVMTYLSGSQDWHWLLVSDLNVAIFLFVAWFLDLRNVQAGRREG